QSQGVDGQQGRAGRQALQAAQGSGSAKHGAADPRADGPVWRQGRLWQQHILGHEPLTLSATASSRRQRMMAGRVLGVALLSLLPAGPGIAAGAGCQDQVDAAKSLLSE